MSYNPEHHNRMKHVERRHFFVRDMVEKFEIEVPFVRTHENLADFFTKPFKSAPHFFEMRRHIMNEPHTHGGDDTGPAGVSRLPPKAESSEGGRPSAGPSE